MHVRGIEGKGHGSTRADTPERETAIPSKIG